MYAYQRHRFVFFILRPFFKLYLKWRYNYTAEKFVCKNENFLILANHVCTMDPFMVAMSFSKPIYFVTSDHILRLGFVSKIIDFLVAPISKLKSTTDILTIKNIMKRLSRGRNVCLFPEGNRTFSGCTTYISPAIGKLIKALNSDIVMYIIDKGYLADPRWGETVRKGELKGYVKYILKPEEYKKMTPEQIAEIVIEQLHVDPTPLDEPNVIPFKGKRLAEHLEREIFICPDCHGISTIHTRGDKGLCTQCGLSFTYDVTGYLKGREGFPFQTIKQWDDWQREFINGGDINDTAVLCRDTADTMYHVYRAKKNVFMGKGTISLFRDRIEFFDEKIQKNYIFRFHDIDSMIVLGRQVLQFNYADKIVYEFKNKHVRNAIKYMYYYYNYKERSKCEDHGYFGI